MLCIVFTQHMVASGDWPQVDLQFSRVSGMSDLKSSVICGRMQD